MKRGLFITVEGADGSGKSTQIEFICEYLERKNIDYIFTREPGETPISEKIRAIILDKDNSEMDPVAEALLYAASRAQHVNQLIGPALERGKVVICDRFVDSSIAYQGYGRGLGELVSVINSYAIGKYMPDITFLFELPVEVGLERLKGSKDRMESQEFEFHKAVSEGYEEIKKNYKSRIIPIDAERSVSAVKDDIISHMDRIIGATYDL